MNNNDFVSVARTLSLFVGYFLTTKRGRLVRVWCGVAQKLRRFCLVEVYIVSSNNPKSRNDENSTRREGGVQPLYPTQINPQLNPLITELILNLLVLLFWGFSPIRIESHPATASARDKGEQSCSIESSVPTFWSYSLLLAFPWQLIEGEPQEERVRNYLFKFNCANTRAHTHTSGLLHYWSGCGGCGCSTSQVVVRRSESFCVILDDVNRTQWLLCRGWFFVLNGFNWCN